MSEHYSTGRKWSVISQAWILESSWNDREELAALRDELARTRVERNCMYDMVKDLEAKLAAAVAERDKAVGLLRAALFYVVGETLAYTIRDWLAAHDAARASAGKGVGSC